MSAPSMHGSEAPAGATRWPREAWAPLVAGLLWLWAGADHSALLALLMAVPGALLVGGGVMMLLSPGELRISQLSATGGVLGVVLSALLLFVDPGQAWWLALLGAAGAVAGGYHALRIERPAPGVPQVGDGLLISAEAVVDEVVLGSWTVLLPIALADSASRIAREVQEAREQFAARGLREDPARYLKPPPAIEAARVKQATTRGIGYEHLSFESGYEPEPGEPGRERWLERGANRTAHAWLLRHREGPRPTLICIHGYQMGSPGIDMMAFQAERLHRELGLDVVLPVLPLHGPRKFGRVSGDGFLAGDVLDTLHAEAQAVWDLRRLLGWLRAQGAPRIGVHGLSLGGYNAALLAGFEPDLACVIAVIPAVDLMGLMLRHGPPLQVQQVETQGLHLSDLSEFFDPVAPLRYACRIAPEGRALYAAIADRIVPAEQAVALWRHWERPAMEWYPGAHCTFMLHAGVGRFVTDVLRDRLV